MTAGNSTPLTDGAAAVLLSTREWAQERDLPVLGYHDFVEGLSRGFAAHHAGMLPLFREIGRNCIYEQPHPQHWCGCWSTHPLPDEELLNLCDEEGIAVFEPTVKAGCMSRVYNDPIFRRDYLKETRMHMRLYRKHPCVIGWSMSMNSFNPKDAIHPDTLGQRWRVRAAARAPGNIRAAWAVATST